MKKRLLALTVSVLAAFAVGCNSVGDSSSEESKTAETAETAVSDTDTAESSKADEKSEESSKTDTADSEETADTSESDEKEESGNVDSAEEPEDSEASDGVSVQMLDELVEKNFDCMTKIFVLGSLPCEDIGADGEEINWEDENSYIRKVTDSRFPDYESFSEYIHSVYTESTADMLLNSYPFEGGQKYLNKDGELYIDLSKDGGKGYYVNWQNRTISIVEQNENTCYFNIETTIEEPADEPVEKPYTINCTAVYENGRWVLEDMYS